MYCVSSLFLARSSSAAVGPAAASLAISCAISVSSSATSTPGRALAMTTKQFAISVPNWKAFTVVAFWAS